MKTSCGYDVMKTSCGYFFLTVIYLYYLQVMIDEIHYLFIWEVGKLNYVKQNGLIKVICFWDEVNYF